MLCKENKQQQCETRGVARPDRLDLNLCNMKPLQKAMDLPEAAAAHHTSSCVSCQWAMCDTHQEGV